MTGDKEKKGVGMTTILIIIAILSVLSAVAIPLFKGRSANTATIPAPVTEKAEQTAE